MHWLSTDTIAFCIAGYNLSYVELVGTLFGLLSVWFASKTNVLTWPTGIINEVFLFALFYQVQLYADMFLQIFFFVVTVYGWYSWRSNQSIVKITGLNSNQNITLAALLLLGVTATGILIQNLHNLLPKWFPLPAQYPFADSFIMVLSIAATYLLAKKHIETWVLWLAVDVVAVAIYYQRGIYFLSAEYVVFLGLATYGFVNWKKQLRNG